MTPNIRERIAELRSEVEAAGTLLAHDSKFILDALEASLLDGKRLDWLESGDDEGVFGFIGDNIREAIDAARAALSGSEKPKPEPLDGAFDHKDGCRAPDGGECSCTANSLASRVGAVEVAESAASKQRVIDILNLRFYAEMFRQHEWSTVVFHWGVFEQTLNEIADRLSALTDAVKPKPTREADPKEPLASAQCCDPRIDGEISRLLRENTSLRSQVEDAKDQWKRMREAVENLFVKPRGELPLSLCFMDQNRILALVLRVIDNLSGEVETAEPNQKDAVS